MDGKVQVGTSQVWQGGRWQPLATETDQSHSNRQTPTGTRLSAPNYLGGQRSSLNSEVGGKQEIEGFSSPGKEKSLQLDSWSSKEPGAA